MVKGQTENRLLHFHGLQEVASAMGSDLCHAEGNPDAAERLWSANPVLRGIDSLQNGQRVYFGHKPTVEQLRHLAQQGYVAVIETHCTDDALGETFTNHLCHGGLGWSLRTDTANDCDFSHFLAEQFCGAFGLKDGMLETLDLALSEALSNAITHGNLDMAGLSGADISRFAAYCDLRSRRLGDEAHGGQRLDISGCVGPDCLEIAVLDRGNGYQPTASQDPPPLIGGGLGLEILKTLATELVVSEGGRCVILRFQL